MKKIAYLDFIRDLLADESEFQAFKTYYQQRLLKSIKIISSRIKKSDLLPYFYEQNWVLKAPDFSFWPLCYDDVCYVEKEDTKSLGAYFLHQWGFFYVQEVSAGLSAQVLSLEKWDKVLDLCAAPGGKTIQLADQLLKLWWGYVVANEVLNARRKALIFNLNRCGMLNTAVSAYDGTQIGDLAPEFFDKVLVDAPCSWEGMQYKHDKTVHIWDQKSADQLAKLQVQLLISGLKALKVWWTLVYSTCTLNPFENEWVLSEVLSTFWKSLELQEVPIDQKSKGFARFKDQIFLSLNDSEKVARFRPHIQHTGGFFIAKIKKIAPLPYEKSEDKRTFKESFFDTSSQLQEQVREFLDKNWWIQRQTGFSFFASQHAIYLTNFAYSDLSKKLFIEKFWIPIFKIGYSWERVPQQGLAMVLGNYAEKNTLEITSDQAQKLTENGILKGNFWTQGDFLILTWRKQAFALAKQWNSEIKVKR